MPVIMSNKEMKMRAFKLALVSAVAFGLAGPAFAQVAATVAPTAPIAKSTDATATTNKAPASTEMKSGGTVSTPSTTTSSDTKAAPIAIKKR